MTCEFDNTFYLIVRMPLITSQSQTADDAIIALRANIVASRRVARIWIRGGGYFERVRSVQTTLTRIFIELESV